MESKFAWIHGRYPAEFRTMDDFDSHGPAVLIGVCSLIHLYRAVYEHRIQSTCFDNGSRYLRQRIRPIWKYPSV